MEAFQLFSSTQILKP